MRMMIKIILASDLFIVNVFLYSYNISIFDLFVFFKGIFVMHHQTYNI